MTDPELFVEDLTLSHLQDFVSYPIRQADVDEWLDGLGAHPSEGLLTHFRPDQYGRAMSIKDVGVVLVWGCHVADGVGTLWLVASDYDLSLAPLIHREFGQAEMDRVLNLAPLIQAYPSSKNTLHHRWLEHYGFKKVRTLRFPASTVPFYRYVRRRNVL